MTPINQVLFVDDEEVMRMAVSQWLTLAGFDVAQHSDPTKLLPKLSPDFPGVVVSDVRMPGTDGLALLQAAQQRDPDLPVILITGHGDIPLAVEAMRQGAYDFIEKPFVPERLTETVRRACEKRELVLENRRLRAEAATDRGMAARLIGTSKAMETVRAELTQLASTALNVVILGETGCGKELAARCLHDFGPRAEKPFVGVNCAAIPETMFESEFFGHEAGAFTGSQQRRIGKIEHADGGTLFLDEIESMPLALQAKVLRTLQEQCVEPLGTNKVIPVNVRTITAVKTDLMTLVENGSFREDLYYRLHVAEIRLPPLRDRREDIPLLFEHFVQRAAAAHGRDPRPLAEANLHDLMTHDWPGNVRELRNAAERFALGIATRRPVQTTEQSDAAPPIPNGSLYDQMADFERRLIENALSQAKGDVGEVMRLLDLPRRTLNEKMNRYGIDRQRYIGR